MLIVDAQVHMWGADTPQRPWPDRGPPQRKVALEWITGGAASVHGWDGRLCDFKK